MTSSSAIPPAVGDRSLTASEFEGFDYEDMEIEANREVIDDDHDVEGLSPSIGNGGDEKREIIIISDDEESSEYDGGYMTVETTNSINECSKQETVSDKAPHFEEQTMQIYKPKTWWIRMFMKDSRHDLSVMKSNDEKSSHCDSGIMTAEITNPNTNGCKSNEVPHFEEQTTQKNIKKARWSMEDCRHDLSIMKSNDEKSSQCDCGIMTAETTNPITGGCKQVTTYDEVPHFEEQTTCMITKDVSDAQQKESTCTHVSMKASRHDQSEKSSQCVGGIMISKTTNSVNECGKQSTASNKVHHFEKQITQMNTKDADVAQQKESRLDDDVTLIGPRSLSHAMEVNKGNKHIGYMGSSSRFRHTNTKNVGDIQNKSQKSDEGVSKGAKSIITCSSEIMRVSHKEIPVSNYSFNYAYKDNNPFMSFPTNQISYATKREESVLCNDVFNTRYNVSSSCLKFDSKASSFDWEPTKGFRSDFLVSQGVSIPDILFDPNRNGIEPLLKHIGDVVQAGEILNDDGPTQEGDTHRGTKLHRECKQLRCFSAALTKSVKGLLKSSWHDGNLSKDAYKLIVKKTVNKVVTTLPSKEIPNIKNYLTSSETKLMKIVERYIAKYGKI